jgi:hypothetical protein
VQEKKLVVILADISGYTRFMLENRTSAVHGQLCINSLIESILEQVDIPLTLQEIEGDAVFLYAADPGSPEAWQQVVEEVGRKLAHFFEVFIARTGALIESTPCGCAICRNSDQLGLKILVHAGEAVFHEVAGRPQVSGPDVILAHRLLKNSLESKEYLLLTEPAFELMGGQLPGRFEPHEETYEGFGRVPAKVRFLEPDFLAARDAVYQMTDPQREQLVESYLDFMQRSLPSAALEQARRPIRAFGWRDKLLMLWDASVRFRRIRPLLRRAIPEAQRARGKRRTAFAGPAEPGTGPTPTA